MEHARLSYDSQPKKPSQLPPIITVSAPPQPTKVDINSAKKSSLSGSSSSASSSRYSRRPVPMSFITGKEKLGTNNTPASTLLSRTPSARNSKPDSGADDPRPRSNSTSLMREPVTPSEGMDLRRDDIFTILKRTGGISSSRTSKDNIQWSANMAPLSKPQAPQRSSLIFPRTGKAAEKQTPTFNLGNDSGSQSRIATSSLTPRASKMPPPLRLNLRHSPGSPPPTDALPVPPNSAPPSASTIIQGMWTQSPRTEPQRSPQTPVLVPRPSYSNEERLSSEARSRSGTWSSTSSSVQSDDQRSATSSPNMEAQRARTVSSSTISRRIPSPHEGSREGARIPATIEQLRDTLNSQSARYAKLSTHLIELTERHAAEKRELLHRIDQLEREAQKREREIKGLRWLVSNVHRNVTGDQSADRFRTLSQASRISIGPGSTPSITEERALKSTIHSHGGSSEDDLLELQNAASDLIEPFLVSPSSATDNKPVSDGVRDRVRSKKRSNTLPSTPRGLNSPNHMRQTSSPVLPAGSSSHAVALPTNDSASTPGVSDMAIRNNRIARVSFTGLGINTAPDQSPTAPELSSLPSLGGTASNLLSLSDIPEASMRKHSEFAELIFNTAVHTSPRRPSIPYHSSSPPSPSFSTKLLASPSPSIEQVLDEAEL